MLIEAILPLHGRPENTFPLMHRLLVGSSRRPDYITVVCEDKADFDGVQDALTELIELELIDSRFPPGFTKYVLPTPKEGGVYTVIPYSNKINFALDQSIADAIVYVDNGSMPAPEKFELMARELELDASIGAVYCTQERTGFHPTTHCAVSIIEDGYGQVNFTQVMHRPVKARWTTDMTYANPDLADALFWREIAKELGPLYPVGGIDVLDRHHIPSPAANGL